MSEQTAIATRENAAIEQAAMNGNKALVRGNANTPPLTKNELEFFGHMVDGAGLIPKENGMTDKQRIFRAMAKIVAGHAYGFDPVLSMRTFDIINGKLQPTGECVSLLIKRSGRYNYKVVEWTHEKCILQFFEKNGDGQWKSAGRSEFSITDAKRAGLTEGSNKHNWTKYTRNMLYWRAVTNGKRLFCADVMDTGGYLPDHGASVADAIGEPQDAEFVEPAQLEAGEAETVNEDVGSNELPFNADAEFSGPQNDESANADLIIAIGDLFSEKLNGEVTEIKKFLKGRDLSQMSNEALTKLHGDLMAY